MVEIAHFRSGISIPQPLVPKDVLRHIGGSGRFASAKIALDTSATVGCGIWESASLTPMLESPRRQVIRNMFASRNERQAVREQRRLEIERELFIRLGMNDTDSDGLSPTGAPSTSAVSIDNTDAIAGQPAFGNEARPPSRSMERPGSGRRAGLSSSFGPPRPPKPKPHRPLNVHDDSLPLCETSADNLPEERRWKSALLLVWPDRQGNTSQDVPDATHASDRCFYGVQGCCHDVQDVESHSHAVQAHESCSYSVALSPSLKHSLTNSHLESSTAYDPNNLPIAGIVPQSNTESVALSGNDSCTTLELEADSPRCASSPLLAPDVTPTGLKSAESAEVAAIDPEERIVKILEDAKQERRLQEVLPQAQELRNTSHLAERTQELEANAQRLRENVERLRLENRRSRVFGSQPSQISMACDSVATDEHSGKEQGSTPDTSLNLENQVDSAPAPTDESLRRLEEMRRKIAELDRINELERQLLEKQEMEVQERRRQQEEFERRLQECTERKMQEHRDREAEAEVKRKEREEEKQREREERLRRRKVQLHQEEEKSRRLEEQRRHERSETAQQKWELFEEELDRQWADQEEEERRRVNTYAKERRRQFEALDRRLASERQKFASEAEFTEAARHRQARNAAHADEQFYSVHRSARGASGTCPSKSVDPPRAPMPPPRHHPGNADSARPILIPDECAVLKELHSMQHQSRDSQKAKVKELLFRWHPDKNPTCADKATRVFQFVQRQREIILGL